MTAFRCSRSGWRSATASERPITVNTFTSEILAAVEYESQVETAGLAENPYIQVETDYSFVATHAGSGSNKVANWIPDKQYTTQVNYRLEAPLLLETKPPLGPAQVVQPGGAFETFRIFELIHDGTERERRGLAVRRMYRTLAPWTTENPILMHVRSADPQSAKLAIDQCAAVGFEMAIMSFGSGFNIEKEDAVYLAQVKDLVDYGKSKGVELGGYSLLASRKIDDEDDAINPATGKPGGAIFGNSPCLGSRWGNEYFRKVMAFIEKTGISVLEHDGSYPGDVCASTTHPGHRGLDDSQWAQWKKIAEFYAWCRARGVYLNVPDWYFLEGSNKTAMGYREANWSLPRERQILLGRQNIFDGTWEKTPSMGWMFVPLVQYQGGGAAATLEPLARTPRCLRRAPGAELRVRRPSLLPRPAPVRLRRDEGSGQALGGFLQAPPRHSRFRYHSRSPAGRAGPGRDSPRQSRDCLRRDWPLSTTRSTRKYGRALRSRCITPASPSRRSSASGAENHNAMF